MRVTRERLQAKVDLINKALNKPMHHFNPEFPDKAVWMVGNYHLDKDVTGFRLCQTVSEGGSTRDVSSRLSPKAMLDYLNAFLDGIFELRR